MVLGCGPRGAPLPTVVHVDEDTGNRWLAEHADEARLDYLVTLPFGYGDDPQRPWPLIVFLHSLAERGLPIDVLIDNPVGEGPGLARFALADPDFPFLTVSPLCPRRRHWPMVRGRLDALLAEVTERYPVDRDRIYLTGVSMGGMGTWALAMAHPGWFAAIAPISGGIYSPPMREDVAALRHVPVWAFHDRSDPEIPISREQGTIDRLESAGGTVRYTVTDQGEHYLQAGIYAEAELFDWFLEHRRHQAVTSGG